LSVFKIKPKGHKLPVAGVVMLARNDVLVEHDPDPRVSHQFRSLTLKKAVTSFGVTSFGNFQCLSQQAEACLQEANCQTSSIQFDSHLGCRPWGVVSSQSSVTSFQNVAEQLRVLPANPVSWPFECPPLLFSTRSQSYTSCRFYASSTLPLAQLVSAKAGPHAQIGMPRITWLFSRHVCSHLKAAFI
jgi:hypothetical protein